MKIRHGITVCVAALLGTTAWAMEQGPASPPDSSGAGASSSLGHTTLPSGMAAGTGINHDTTLQTTTAFIQRAAQDDATEDAAAQYALANSRSPDVRAFARRALTARGSANDPLRNLAATLGITMPSSPTAAQRHALNRLRVPQGASFDGAYAALIANEHRQTLDRFRRAAQSSRIDPAVRRFAQDSLPVMQDDLQRANRLVASHHGTGNRTAG